ncbi:unnamed protein product [Brachionus calyciflorus]|uniref:Uncharacterized protein n=1 Tax=Brachionus calyciflorus TaxID=104777 RepID=A0A813TQY8_9BILA|nr:unnamed protein product [Brachionus calyciflorus]
MCEKQNVPSLEKLYEFSSDILRDSLVDIINKSSDSSFKIHSLALLNVSDVPSELKIESSLDNLLKKLKSKFVRLNMGEEISLKNDDFDDLESLNEKKNDDIDLLDYKIENDKFESNESQFDFFYIENKNNDDFDLLECVNTNKIKDDFDLIKNLK